MPTKAINDLKYQPERGGVAVLSLIVYLVFFSPIYLLFGKVPYLTVVFLVWLVACLGMYRKETKAKKNA